METFDQLALAEMQKNLKYANTYSESYVQQMKELDEKKTQIKNDLIFNSKKYFYYHNFSVSASAFGTTSDGDFFANIKNWEIRNQYLTSVQKNCLVIIIRFFLKNATSFANSILLCITEFPEYLERIIFSTIPSIFCSLAYSQCIQEYVELIIELCDFDVSIGSYLARPLFIIPCFANFIKMIIREGDYPPSEFKNAFQADLFVDKMYKNWTAMRNECPCFLKQIISKLKSEIYACTFIEKAFFEQLCDSPRSFVPIQLHSNTKQSFQHVREAFQRRCPSFIDLIMKTPNPAEIVPVITGLTHRTVLFLHEDIEMLLFLAKIAKNNNDMQFDISLSENIKFLSPSDLFCFELIINPNQVQKEEKIPDKIPLFKCLSDLLTKIPEVPPLSPDLTISCLLDTINKTSSPSNQLETGLMIDLISDSYKSEINEVKILNFIEFLSEKSSNFKTQMKEMTKKITSEKEFVEMISYYKSKANKFISEKENAIMAIFIQLWSESTNYKSTITPQLLQQLCSSPEQFSEYFKQTEQKCLEFCQSKGVKGDVSEPLHNEIMTNIPLETFLKYSPDHSHEDNDILEILNSKGFSMNVFQGINEQQTKKTLKKMRNIIENPDFLDQATKFFRQFLETPLPTQKLRSIHKSFRKVGYIAAFEIEEVGEDDILPLRLFMTSIVKPAKLISNINYIQHFLKVTGDEAPNSKLKTLWSNKETLDLIVLPESLMNANTSEDIDSFSSN